MSLQLLYLAYTKHLSKNRSGLQILDSQNGTPTLEYLRCERDKHVLQGSKNNTRGQHMSSATVSEQNTSAQC